jgi:hypothetical protein
MPWRKRMPAAVQSPEKELRFTRARQAAQFGIAAAVFTGAAVILAICGSYRDIDPSLPHPLWALAPLALALVFARWAGRLAKHAYLILTPLGIEVFPFFRPADGMRLIAWGEIAAAEVDERLSRLTLHHDVGKTSGVHLSLAPIPAGKRGLLAKAVAGRVASAPI